MKIIDKIINTIAMLLQALIIGIILAWLRHKHRWMYYPIKWFLTFLLSMFITFAGLAAFKLIFGISEKWFSQLMYDIGTSTNIKMAVVWFTSWLVVVGSFVTIFIDWAIYGIENFLYSQENYVKDKNGRYVIQREQAWTPTLGQSLVWNVYGLTAFVFFTYKLLTHQGTSLFNIW